MSLLATLRSGPPPPKVALLPDGMFFTRAVAITAGATPAEAATQVELAVETLAPFPLTQLYYGYFWKPGAESALVFAAYRRRFTAEQTAEWSGAELVLPTFAAVLGADVRPATTLLLSADQSLTAVHWAGEAGPSLVLCRPLDPAIVAAAAASADGAAALEAERARVRDALIREIGGSHTVIDLAGPPVAEATRTDREVQFRTGEQRCRFTAAQVAGLDVRDKTELAARRAAHRRDVLLWRLTLGAAAALLVLGLGEIALIGGAAWQKVRTTKVRAQQPKVEKILTSQDLANRIDDLATKRLLPWEMIMAVIGEKRQQAPADIQFDRVYTTPQSGIYTISIDAHTANVGSIAAFKTILRGLPTVESADTSREQTVGGKATFTLTVTFKPDAIKPGALL